MKDRRMSRFLKIALPSAAALVLVMGALWGGTIQYAPEGSGDAFFPILRNQAERKDLGMKSDGGEYVFFDDNSVSLGSMPESDWDGWDDWQFDAEVAEESFAGATENASDSGMERKIIRTANLTLATTAFEQSEEGLRARITEMGGYVENLSQHGDGSAYNLRRVTMTVRVPADRMDAFLAGAVTLGRVTYKSESAADVTAEYTDTSLRLATQRAKAERLRELLLKAEVVSDLLEIESEIADTQYRIDAYETSLRGIDRNVAHSTVHITLTEETPTESAAATAVTLGDRTQGALQASLRGIAQFFENMLVFAVWAAPYVVGIGAIGVVVWIISRSRRKAEQKEQEVNRKEE